MQNQWPQMNFDMKKEKPYSAVLPQEPSIAAEPVATYGYTTNSVQALRNRVVDAVAEIKDENLLMECLELLHADTMPCVFTDEEFEEELRLSEASGTVSHEEALEYFAKWGIVR